MNNHSLLLTTAAPLVIFIGFFVIIFAVLFCGWLFLRHLQSKRNFQHRLELMRVNNTNEVLRAQVEIQEQTFRNIAHDLHDNIGQKLTYARFRCEQDAAEIGYDNKATYDLISDAIQDLRNLSHGLNGDAIKSLGLLHTITNDIERLQRPGIFDISFSVTKDPVRLSDDKEILIFRIYQELMQNILKHADAAEVRIFMTYTDTDLSMCVTDNGKGFRTNAPKGQGLNNIEQRLKLLGARMNITSNQKGTIFQTTIPYQYENN